MLKATGFPIAAVRSLQRLLVGNLVENEGGLHSAAVSEYIPWWASTWDPLCSRQWQMRLARKHRSLPSVIFCAQNEELLCSDQRTIRLDGHCYKVRGVLYCC